MTAGGNESSKKVVSGGALAVWLLLPLVVLVVLKTDCLPQVTVRQLFAQFSFTQPAADGSANKVPSSGTESATQQQAVDVARLKSAHDPVVGAPPPTASSNEMAAGVADANGDLKNQTELLAMNGERDDSGVNSDVAAPRSKLSCNFSFYRMNICAMEGDVRTHGKVGTVYVVSPSDDSYRPENGTVTIRPYPRKWEKLTMQLAREVTIRSSGPGAADMAPPRPRLVMLLRRHSRALTNEAEAVAAAAEVGFEVVAAGPEAVRDMAHFAEVVNSCDVMVGVHGAGLTNMVFLPHNGTAMQIIPWGEMKWPCWSIFGETVPDMGLRYVEYEATAEETTLKDVYPRDHPVFTNPVSIHKQGFDQLWKIFLDGQNVTLDINRFRGVMQQIYQDVTVT
uniref:Putative glycosyltransferase AGO61 n=1 Tax=Aegilops tauschii TaxID=37682 RepID=N1QUJ7_AEGTA